MKQDPQKRQEAFQVLYDHGWSDLSVGKALGVSPGTIANWRSARGLPVKPCNNVQKFDDEIGFALYREGASDVEIARRFGATQSGATLWRQRHGLPPNVERAPALTDAERRHARKLLRQGATCAQVAEATGRCLATISRLRQGMHDPELRRAGLSNAMIRRRVLDDPAVKHRIERALGPGMPDDVRADAFGDLYLDVLSGMVAVDLIEKVAPSYRNKAYSMCGSRFGPRSLDEDLGDGWTLGDSLADDAALEAFDQIEWE